MSRTAENSDSGSTRKNFLPRISALLNLLDDDNEEVAVSAMAELLSREDELGKVLAELQESSNVLVRKRAHQLQAAITLRRRRRDFSNMLKTRQISMIDGLIEVHLQWFDNDSRPGLQRLWSDFADEASHCLLRSLRQLSYFMCRRGMIAVHETSMQPENYCIGAVLEAHYGSSALFAAIGQQLAADAGLNLSLVRVLGEFALLDTHCNLVIPVNNWQLETLKGVVDCDFWNKRSLLQFASSMLFSNAVSSDSFRYIQTIAQALIGLPDGELPETFPYPYRSAEDDC